MITDTVRYTRNSQVIHNIHIFKKYFENLWELAYNSNIRIAEREIEREEKKAKKNWTEIKFK